MPLLIVPSNQPSRILKLVAVLFLANVIAGGGLGLWVEHEFALFPDAYVIQVMLGGSALAIVLTALVFVALYRRATRAVAPERYPLGNFLEEALYGFVGIAGVPSGILILSSAWDIWRRTGKADVGWGGFGAVMLLASMVAVRRFVSFLGRTRPKASESTAAVG